MTLISLPLLFSSIDCATVRDGELGNCVGVRSCRPRCITFEIERDREECNARTGVFNVTGDITPWDTNRFESHSCNGTCWSGKCGQPLPGNLTIRIGEDGYSGSKHYTFVDIDKNKDFFTHCSIYPCPKDECLLPEQMGSVLDIQFHSKDVDKNKIPGRSTFEEEKSLLLALELFLKPAFLGPVRIDGEDTQFGPLRVVWMDDPSNCRQGEFLQFAPISPPLEPSVIKNSASSFNGDLYCPGEEYQPLPLPLETPSPSGPPSKPVTDISLSSLPSNFPALLSQKEALQHFFLSTKMDTTFSMLKHSWFAKGSDTCCLFTGITCREGYIESISLSNMGLSGTLPSAALEKLTRLRRLILSHNDIKGTIPTSLFALPNLVVIELEKNNLVGNITDEINMSKLRRLMVS